MPSDLAAYQRFVGAVVTRYAPYGVTEYAIENEVNAPSYWAGSPEDYVRLVKAAAETIRATDPKALVVDSGISSVAYGMGVADRLLQAGRVPDAVAAYRAYFQRRVGTRGQQIPAVTGEAALRKALGTDTNTRSLRFLAATETLLADRTVDVRQLHFYEHFDGVPPLLDYLRDRTPAGMPIQAWEVGQFWRDGDGDPAGRAAEMVKTVTLLVAGGIGEIAWLPLAYNPNNAAGSEVRYGLLDPNGTEREAGAMMASLAEAARDATVTPLPASTAGKLAGVAFVRGGTSTLVLWSTSGTPVTVPVAPGGQTGAVGAPLRAAAGAGTTVGATPCCSAPTSRWTGSSPACADRRPGNRPCPGTMERFRGTTPALRILNWCYLTIWMLRSSYRLTQPRPSQTSSRAEPNATPLRYGFRSGVTATLIFCSSPVHSWMETVFSPLAMPLPTAWVTCTVRVLYEPGVQATLTGANTTAPFASSRAFAPSFTIATDGDSDCTLTAAPAGRANAITPPTAMASRASADARKRDIFIPSPLLRSYPVGSPRWQVRRARRAVRRRAAEPLCATGSRSRCARRTP